MCGIAGWFDMKGHRAPDRALLKAMSDAIAHRGPMETVIISNRGWALDIADWR